MLGIGANAAIFSVVNGVLRHPAGVDYPERVAVMKVRYTQFSLDIPFVSVPDLMDAAALKDQVEAASLARDTSFNIVHDGTVEHLPAEQVGVQWFQVFGARPILGRTFTAQEDQPGAGPVAVISYSLWQRAFGGRRDVLDDIMLDQKPYQVVGVMRSDFDWPRGKQLWVPIALTPQAFAAGERFNEFYYAYLRLRPGISFGQLNAGLAQKMHEEVLREGKNAYGASSGWFLYATRSPICRRPSARTSPCALCSRRARAPDSLRQRRRALPGAHFRAHARVCHPHRPGSQCNGNSPDRS